MATYNIHNTYTQANFDFNTAEEMYSFMYNLRDDAIEKGRRLDELIVTERDDNVNKIFTKVGLNSPVDKFLDAFLKPVSYWRSRNLSRAFEARDLKTMEEVEYAFFQGNLLYGKFPFTKDMLDDCVKMIEISCGKDQCGELEYNLELYKAHLELASKIREEK